MASRNDIDIYAAGNDVKLALGELFAREELKLVLSGLLRNPDPIDYEDFEVAPELGVTAAKDQANVATFLIMRRDTVAEARSH